MDRIRDNKTKPWYRDPRTPVYVILPNCIPKKKRKNHESRTNWCRKSETEDGRIGPSNFASQLEDSVVEPKIEHVGKEPSESPGRGEGIMTLFFFFSRSKPVRSSLGVSECNVSIIRCPSGKEIASGTPCNESKIS
jgi:hypothetical protein